MHYSYAYLLNKYQCSIIRTYKEPGCTLQRESQLTNIPPPTHIHTIRNPLYPLQESIIRSIWKKPVK